MSHTKLFIIAGGIAVVIVGAIYFDSLRKPSGCSRGDTLGSLCGDFQPWKTYRNEEYGFEVKYPEMEVSVPINVGTNPHGPRIVFAANDFSVVIDENYHGSLTDFRYMSISPQGATTSGFEIYSLANSSVPFIAFATASQGKIYIIEFQGRTKLDARTEQILSTFKFIVPGEPGLLAKVVNSGGLCADGPCHWETAIYQDGRIVVEGETQHISSAEVASLNTAIGGADFEQIRSQRFAGMCPAAYDGPLYTFEFMTSGGVEILNSCETEIHRFDPLFVVVENLVAKYSGIVLSPYSGNGTLSGKVSIGPICPVEQIDNPCPTPPEAYASREFLVNKDGKTVTSFHADSNGDYSISLVAGTYIITPTNTGIGFVSKELPANVTIKSGSTVTLNIDVDTGIR